MEKKNVLRILIIIALTFLCADIFATDYTWKGGTSVTGTLWNINSNWSPSGYPKDSNDKAIFNSTSTKSCTLTQNTTIAEVIIESGYSGTITITPFSLTADIISLSDGTIISAVEEKFIAKKNLNIISGNYLTVDLTCDGDVTFSGGAVGILRMRGNDSHLTKEQSTPQPVASLIIAKGKTTISKAFVATLLNVNTNATLQLEELASLTMTNHNIEGTIILGSVSGLIFSTSANITGTIDASTSGSTVLCNGDWNCTGTYIPTGKGSNVITIIQTANGSIIDHGNNKADAVIIQNGASKKTTWKSTNEIFELTVSKSSTLEIAQNAVLTTRAITNAGKIIENLPGHIHCPAQSVRGVNESNLPLPEILLGGSFKVNVVDLDELLDFDTVDIAQGITVTNPRNNDTINIEAKENLKNSMILLTELIPTEDAEDAIVDNKIQAKDGDVLNITYVDNEDAEDKDASSTLKISTTSTNIPPTIQILTPSIAEEPASQSYAITWLDFDPDNNAAISLYYDTDRIGHDGTLIIDNISEDDTANNFSWNLTGVPIGVYYIYGKIDDGVNPPNYSYSIGTVKISSMSSTDIVNHLLGLNTIPEEQLPLADKNTDGIIDIADLVTFINEK